jgi:hypothetical protein
MADKKEGLAKLYCNYWKFDKSIEDLKAEKESALQSIRDKNADELDKFREDSEVYINEIDDKYQSFQETAAQLSDMIQYAENNVEDYSPDRAREFAEQIGAVIRSLTDFRETVNQNLVNERMLWKLQLDSSVLRKKTELSKCRSAYDEKINKAIEKQKALSKKQAAEAKEEFNNAVDRILSLNYSAEMLSLVPDEEANYRTELRKFIDEYNDLHQKTERLSNDKDAVMKECFRNYMLLRAPDLIADHCVDDQSFFAKYVEQDPSLRSTLKECKNGDANKSDYDCLCEVVSTYRVVETIYQDYEKVYFAYLEGVTE